MSLIPFVLLLYEMGYDDTRRMTMKRFTNEGRTLVCFDFDETYFPHACTAEQLEHLRRLEDFLEQHSHRFSTMWVTGSSLETIAEKVRRADMRYFPHRIASSLGTELYHVTTAGELELDSNFQSLFPSDFSRRVEQVVTHHALTIEPQTNMGTNAWMHNYYYFGEDEVELERIQTAARDFGIAVNVSRCNPLAGDPVGAYDIDFIPRGAGKTAAVDYVCTRCAFQVGEAYAFGDSGNDLAMLKHVGNGYVLGNGTEQAKSEHDRVTAGSYAEGILEVLMRFVQETRSH
ncbi:HAD-IIB family hydrolase [Exiguobacterium sp. SH1S4]|nr:HAD-IIB family hydrolase [Exiguobacterium sp. SH5S32]TCI55430.1 HAD-IIB family hydrolase [Exiguobacterium sp. SH1S4]TCI75225.1 HAD-IIB family hydrolase [Exiguobacterium sp. SH1S1]